MHIRPTVLDVRLGAIRHNFRLIQRHTHAQAVCAVVKADAYGHGLVPVSQVLAEEGVAWLATALIEEAVSLRDAGLKTPILVMAAALQGAWEALFEYDLVPAIFTIAHLQQLAAVANGRPIAFHLKIDTGMARLGLAPSELEDFLAAAARFPNLRLDGLLTHFANADLGDLAFNQRQLQLFTEAAQRLSALGHKPLWLHIANSAAVMSFPAAHLGLLRPGLLLYGANPMAQPPKPWGQALMPAMRWHTQPVHVKRVPKGTRVSYGGHWTAPKDSLIATLPVGYADGYPRCLGNRANVLVRGRRAAIVGTVCMDLCMADVTELGDIHCGDEVVLMGQQGSDRITPEEVASWANTIAYEVLCGIGKRVPRVYLQNEISAS